jgi:Fe-S cluster assembly ATP-binding protein
MAAIMGPNGAGKSTLAAVLAGKEGYTITSGSIKYLGKNLLDMPIDERAAAGVFLAFQYPVEIPGVATSTFVRTALNAQRRHRGESELDGIEFLKLAREKAKELEMSEDFFQREVNVGFSGGEKKLAEIFQMSMLSPTLAILYETDSGLDIDALKIVAAGVNNLRSDKLCGIVITHYQRLLEHLKPDTIHILADGKIVKTGDKSLAILLEEKGYQGIIEAA